MDMEQSTLPHGRPLTVDQLVALHSNLNSARVSRLQSNGMSYLEAWDVKATLIRMFGYAGFSAECLDAKIIREEQTPQRDNATKMNWSISAQATVRLTIHQTGAIYTESAIATSKQPDWGESADMALKSAESDALKRAAIYLGTQFGLSLYDDGKTSDIIKTTLSPEQAGIMDMIHEARKENPEAIASLTKLQAAMKVHPTTVTQVTTTVSEPTVTEIPVATVTTPPAQAVAKALENAEREAEAITQAEKDAATKRKTTTRTVGRKAAAKVTADRQALARQALANAEQQVGLGDPYAEQNFAMDDERQIAEDSAR